MTWTVTPREPIPQLEDINQWIGHQLNHQKMPDKYMDTPPHGLLITQVDEYPEGLLAVPNPYGSPESIRLSTYHRAQIISQRTSPTMP